MTQPNIAALMGGIITDNQNLGAFSSLKILSLQSNRITKMEGFEGLLNLEELYLSHNGLKKIGGLEKNASTLFSCVMGVLMI
jgi:Leucine-rich repeat (LRR) protein